ncbi:response regulator [Albidovulum aquaemixtae]|uniref:response regulator n=1 Tax=Albidovulum aquaemixtae TaxID=1542388 RepID=UPI000D55C754|nr:response regulator [Defluviimonas aquaemixtae]
MALVYVLEDDPAMCQTVANLVKSLGHSCRAFFDCGSFISATEEVAPDAIILDMWLGTTTALEVITNNSDILAGIPSIMISGGNSDTSLEKVTALADLEGFCDVLYKPFGRGELQAALARHLNSDVS